MSSSMPTTSCKDVAGPPSCDDVESSDEEYNPEISTDEEEDEEEDELEDMEVDHVEEVDNEVEVAESSELAEERGEHGEQGNTIVTHSTIEGEMTLHVHVHVHVHVHESFVDILLVHVCV